MTTLLAVYNSQGCVGTCDAKCYLAKGGTPRCLCICGGKNHGVGVQRAMENIAAGMPFALEHIAAAYMTALDRLCVINRIEVPDSRVARELAYMRINQLSFDFAQPA